MNYLTAHLVEDVFFKSQALIESGFTMRSIKFEFLKSQLVDTFPEGGITHSIYERLCVCRSKKSFLAAIAAIHVETVMPVIQNHARRLAEIRAYNEERAELTVDQAHDKALEQEADLRRFFLKQSRPNSGIRADSETMRRAIPYAHEEALEMDKARGVRPSFPPVMPVAPPMPVAQMPTVASTDAAVYVSGAIQVGDRIEVRYNAGLVGEIRRVYEMVSLPVRVANTCYQTFFVKQMGDHRVHRIAFNATADSWALFGRKEDN